MKGITTVYVTDRAPEGEPSRPPEAASTPDREPDDPRLDVALGLLTPYHRKRLGSALHFYLCLLARRRPFHSPWVGGHAAVYTTALLAAIQEVDLRTMRTWLARLRDKGYIHTETVNTGEAKSSGIRIRILKAKFWRKGRCVVIPDPTPTPGNRSSPPPGNRSSGGGLEPTSLHVVPNPLPQEAKTLPRRKKDSLGAVSEGSHRQEAGARAPKDERQRP